MFLPIAFIFKGRLYTAVVILRFPLFYYRVNNVALILRQTKGHTMLIRKFRYPVSCKLPKLDLAVYKLAALEAGQIGKIFAPQTKKYNKTV